MENRKARRNKSALAAVLILTALLFTGCLGGSGRDRLAQVEVYLTDTGENMAPAALGIEAAELDGITGVYVTITSVHGRRGNTWEKLFDVPEELGPVNLMALQFDKALLGSGEIPAGKYKEVRFEFKGNEGDKLHNYITVNGHDRPLYLPQPDLTLDMDISISGGAAVELVFNIDKSALVIPNPHQSYTFTPEHALHYVRSYKDTYGGISAEIKLPAGVGRLTSINVSLLRDKQVVWQTSLKDGKLSFELQSLPPGNYQLEASVGLFNEILQIKFGPVDIRPGTFERIKLEKK
jgi:hypothetical protein